MKFILQRLKVLQYQPQGILDELSVHVVLEQFPPGSTSKQSCSIFSLCLRLCFLSSCMEVLHPQLSSLAVSSETRVRVEETGNEDSEGHFCTCVHPEV